MLLFDQIQQLEFRFWGSPADTSQFDTLYESIDMSAGLTDRDYAPAQIAEDLPKACRFGIDGDPAGPFVCAEEILASPEPADRLLIVAESPGAHAHPSDVLHRIAEMGQFPIEYRAHAFGTENDVADSVVAVDQRFSRSLWNPLQEPSEGQFERGMWFEGEAPEAFLVAFDLRQRRVAAGLRKEVEVLLDAIDPMNLREDFCELREHPSTRAHVGVVTKEPARDSLAL